jgi:integrase
MAGRAGRRDFGRIRKLPSGRWQGSYLPPGGGDSDRVNAPSTFRTKAEASAWLADVRVKLDQHTWTDPRPAETTTLATFTRRWLKSNPKHGQTTTALYEDETARWVLPRLEDEGQSVELGPLSLARITAPVVGHWYTIMSALVRASARAKAEAGARRLLTHPARWWAAQAGLPVKATGRLSPDVLAAWQRAGSPIPQPSRQTPPDVGADTVARIYRHLHAIMAAAVAAGILTTNPCHIEGAASASASRERAPISEDEALVMWRVYPARYRLSVRVAAETALRAGQVFGLRRRDVEVDNLRLHVAKSLKRIAGKLTLGDPKTEGTARWVAIDASLAKALAAHMEEFTDEDDEAYVFCTSTGQPLDPAQRSTMFRRAREAAGRPDVRWHDLRSVAGMFAYANGATRNAAHGSLIMR